MNFFSLASISDVKKFPVLELLPPTLIFGCVVATAVYITVLYVSSLVGSLEL